MAAAMVNQSSQRERPGRRRARREDGSSDRQQQIARDQRPADALLQQADGAAAVDVGAAATGD